MREIRLSGSEGGVALTTPLLPLSSWPFRHKLPGFLAVGGARRAGSRRRTGSSDCPALLSTLDFGRVGSHECYYDCWSGHDGVGHEHSCGG